MKIESLHKPPKEGRLKVAAYGRVSNDKAELETSLQEQIDHYTRIIVMNPDWEFAGIYYDDGISGTSTEKRTGFNKMIENAKAGLIDIILVKSISRFARNVIDLLTVVRELRNLDIEIYFETQNVSSLDKKCDQMITMYAEFAEEEAISVSENVKWRQDKNMKDGRYFLPVKQMLGYRYDENKKLLIYEPEAKIIRLIYQLYLDGNGSMLICKELTSLKMKNRNGIVKWHPNSIRSILRNEAYVGDHLFRKEYVEDPITHKRKINLGEKEQYIVKNGHPAIIDRRTWEAVQKLMDYKCDKFNTPSYKNGTYSKSNSSTAFTGFIICPRCGSNYISKLNHYNGKKTNRHLMCSSNRESKTCPSENYPFDVFEKGLIQILKILKTNIGDLKDILYKEFEDTDKDERSKKFDKLNSEIEKLRTQLNKIENYHDEFYTNLRNAYLEKITALTNKKVLIENESLTKENIESRVKAILEPLKKLNNDINKVDEVDFKKVFDKAVIVDKGLIYFIIGNGSMKKYPLKPKLIYQTTVSYKVRITTFQTTFGVIINK